MCRSIEDGGRRCPGYGSPEHRAILNKARRDRYAAKISSSGKTVRSYTRTKEVSIEPSVLSSTPLLPVTYGSELADTHFQTSLKDFDVTKIKPVANRILDEEGGLAFHSKPYGGLWSAIYDEDDGSTSWENLIGKTEGYTSHTITPKDDSKILALNSRDDYIAILDAYGTTIEEYDMYFGSFGSVTKRAIDFEKLSEHYDGFYLTDDGVYANGKSVRAGSDEFFKGNSSLDLWDIATLFVLKPEGFSFDKE